MLNLIKTALATSHLTTGASPAACEADPSLKGCGITSLQDFFDLLTRIFGVFFGIIVALSTLFLLYAAFLYVTSRGDTGKIDSAKTIIIYAVVALVVAAIAYAVPSIVEQFV